MEDFKGNIDSLIDEYIDLNGIKNDLEDAIKRDLIMHQNTKLDEINRDSKLNVNQIEVKGIKAKGNIFSIEEIVEMIRTNTIFASVAISFLLFHILFLSLVGLQKCYKAIKELWESNSEMSSIEERDGMMEMQPRRVHFS